MGLDAFVRCNCLKEGKTTEPPIDRTWIISEDDGYYYLDPKYATDTDLEKQLYDWSKNCCIHSGMKIDEHISNWAGLRVFQEILDKIGIEHFPVLSRQLPEMNGGSLSVESAKAALQELEGFEQKTQALTNIYLINVDNNQPIYQYVDAYEGKIMWSKAYSAGFNANGFYIVKSDTDEILFQGKRITQKVYTYPNWLYRFAKIFNIKLKTVRKACWINQDTNAHFYIPWGISVDGKEYPKELIVEERTTDISDVEYIIGQFRKIFQASIEMNNPVFWF